MTVTLDQKLGIASPIAANPTVSTFTHAVAVGALLHVEVVRYNGNPVSGGSVTDGVNTYVLTIDPIVADVPDGGGNLNLTFLSCYCTNGLANGATLSIFYTSSTPAVVQLALSLLGCKPTGYYDISNAAAQNGVTTWVTPTITTTVDGDGIVSGFGGNTAAVGNTPTAPAIDGGTDVARALQYDIQVTHGSTVRGGTWSGTQAAGVAGIVAYKAATVSSPVNTGLPIVTGTPEQNQTLNGTNGTWTGDTSGGFAGQWQVDFYGDFNGVDIPIGDGGTANFFVLDIPEIDCHMRYGVTATGTGGSTTAYSDWTELVVVCVDVVILPVASAVPASTVATTAEIRTSALLGVTFTDAVGNPITPADVTISVSDSGGGTTVYSLSDGRVRSAGGGEYYVEVRFATLGTWTYATAIVDPAITGSTVAVPVFVHGPN